MNQFDYNSDVLEKPQQGRMRPFNFNAQVLGEALLPAIFALPSYAQKNMLKMLSGQVGSEPMLESWYDIKSVIIFYKQVLEDFGPNTLFTLGKYVPENAKFPSEAYCIDKALDTIDVAYSMNHRNGYLGFYQMISHDVEEKKIIMQCYNPYPCTFDRGLLTSMVRKFKCGVRVEVDHSKPNKANGGDESWYIITYR